MASDAVTAEAALPGVEAWGDERGGAQERIVQHAPSRRDERPPTGP